MFKPRELIIRAYPASLSEFRLTDPQDRSIIACPQPPLEAVQAGKAVSAPTGEFDVSVILEQLPNNFQPEIVNLSARNMSFIPRGLEKINCPKVMKIGDTFHWGDGSLSGIIQYCQKLQCDYHWVYQGVQHLHFFVEAGLKNVFWLPGTPVINHYLPEKKVNKSYDIIFRGSQSELHVYRSFLLNFLQQSGVSIDIQTKPYTDCLDDYAQSRIVFNCSLNGDTNRRVFEVLMAGGFLLTDRLSIQSGLFYLFEEGVDLECYGNEEELIDKVNFYLNNPEKAEQIAAAGQQKLINCYSQEKTRQIFYRYVLQGELESPFLLQNDKRIPYIHKSLDAKQFSIRLKVYELIQEIHRLNPKIKLLYWKGTNKELLSDLADMSRLAITYCNSKEAISDIGTWCAEVGIKQQVNLEYLASNLTNKEQFQIVMLDMSDTIDAINNLLLEVEQKVAEFGFLLILGDIKKSHKDIINKLARLKKFTAVNLCLPSRQELGIGACLVYQKVAKYDKDDSTETIPKLFVNQLSLTQKMQIKLDSLPLIRSLKKLKRNLPIKMPI
jgi:Glycosyl transferases group 1